MAIENGILMPSGVIQFRGGTAAALASVNPMVSAREIVVELDTGKIKVGNGTDRWNALPYAGGGGGNHEALEGLFGGTAEDGHYHITTDEHRRLEILIDALFPNDNDTIYIPYIDGNENKIMPYSPFKNLPKGTPLDWTRLEYPSGFAPYSGVHKMFYGSYIYRTSSNSKYLHIESGLHTLMVKGSTKSAVSMTSLVSAATSVDEENYIWEPTASNGNYYDYLLDPNGVLYYTYGAGVLCTANTSTSNSASSYTIVTGDVLPDCNSLCYSKNLNFILAVGATGNAVIMRYSGAYYTGTASTRYSIGIGVNPASAAWSPVHQVFCVTGPEGTATSQDGVTWVTHTSDDVPKNLTDLTYREDLSCFIAWSKDDKLFYASGDGETWQTVSNTPIPLDTVTCVDYTPSIGIYCAVGAGNKAYFSKDLTTWTSTAIVNDTNITVGSVIYMANTRKYVLMPKTGNIFYTYDASNWITETVNTRNDTMIDEDLGVFTASISSTIKDGTFTDIYPGKYFNFTNVEYEYLDENDTLQTGTFTGKMRIMHLDYPQCCGETDFPYHSVLVVPDNSLFTACMNATNTTEGGYVGSKMRTVYLRRAEAIFKACFGEEHILVHQENLVSEVTNGVPSKTISCNTTVELMDERMVFNIYQFDSGTHNKNIEPEASIYPHIQLAAFRHNKALTNCDNYYWLRNIVSAANFARVTSNGYAGSYYASGVYNVRPAALIY